MATGTKILLRPLEHVTRKTREKLYGTKKGSTPPGDKRNTVKFK